MKFLCDSCGTKYSIADERVRGRVLKIRCKKCDFVITVREDVQAAAAALQLPNDDEFGKALDAIGGGEQTSIGGLDGTAGSVKPSAEVDDWYVSFDGEQEGPFSIERAIERVKLELKSDKEAHAWRPGFLVWLPVEEVPELAPALLGKKPAQPPRIPVQATAAAPVGGASAFGLGAASGKGGVVGAQIAKDPSGPRAALSVNAGSAGSASIGEPARPADLFAPAPAPMFAASAPSSPAADAPDLPISNEASGLVNLAQLSAAAFGQATGPAFINGHTVSPGRATGSPGRATGSPGRGTGGARALPTPNRQPALGEPMSALDDLPATASSGPVVVVAGAAQGGGSSPIFKWLAVLGLLATGGLGFGMWYVYTHRPAAETIIVTEPSRHVDDSPITVTDPVTGKVTVVEPKKGGTAVGGKKVGTKTTAPIATTAGPKTDNMSGSQKALQDLYRDGVEHTPHDVGAQNRGGSAGTQVSQASIMAAVNTNKRSLNLCFDRALKHDSSLKSGRVPIQVTVGMSGRVTAVVIPEAQYASTELGQCFISAVKKWSFPASDASYTTEFPFILQGQ